MTAADAFDRLRLPRRDVLFGMAVSVIVHAVMIFVVVFLPHVLPRKPVELPYYSVKLVTAGDLGLDQGSGGKGPKAQVKAPQAPPSAPKRDSAASVPVVPVKRLADSFKLADTKVEKLDADVKPTLERIERPSLEKSVEQLLPKEKAERPKPPPGPTPPSSASGGSASSAAPSGTTPSAKPAPSEGSSTAGSAPGPSGSSGAARGASGPSGPGGRGEELALARRLYYTEVWAAIKRQWVLPKSLINVQGLEAVVVIVVRRDGKIESMQFEKRSGNQLFDDSVLRAIQKADPLPKFPDIYSPPRDEIGVRFRPEDLA
uniref:TonB family protein n=1 Tax=Desulfacinum infernum TaxID=35837 RepID=A0A832A0P5_9BACT